MRGTLLLVGLMATLLSGCAPAAVVYGGSRANTEDALGRYIVETRPELAVRPAVECAKSGMTYAEIVKFGLKDTTRLTTASRATLGEIMQRTVVADCIAALPEAEVQG